MRKKNFIKVGRIAANPDEVYPIVGKSSGVSLDIEYTNSEFLQNPGVILRHNFLSKGLWLCKKDLNDKEIGFSDTGGYSQSSSCLQE
jgi:hypothetical protein